MEQAQERAAEFRRQMEAAGRVTGASRRREEVIEQAMSDGDLSRELAQEAYDLAVEESVDPPYALALVRSGFVVRELVRPEPADEAMQQDAPAWIAPEPATQEVTRERRLRAGLRRLRRMLERCGGPGEAAAAFVAEPDVGPGEY